MYIDSNFYNNFYIHIYFDIKQIEKRNRNIFYYNMQTISKSTSIAKYKIIY